MNNEQKYESVRQAVDAVFEKYNDKKANIIPIEEAYIPWDNHVLVRPAYEEFLDWIIWYDKEDPGLNPYYKPIGWKKKYESITLEWCNNLQEDAYSITRELYKCGFKRLDIEKYAKKRIMNEYWYQVTAITRDYKFVLITIRNDGFTRGEYEVIKDFSK